jgi:hypothetical protein
MTQQAMREITDLSRVLGGRGARESDAAPGMTSPGRTTSLSFRLPLAGSLLSLNSTEQEPDVYLRCLGLVGRQAGVLSTTKTTTQRQVTLCSPLLAKK